MTDELQRLRKDIDRLDEEILQRLSARASIARRIGHVKQGGVVYRPEREAQVLDRLAELNTGPLESAVVVRIFREIMSACLALEQPLKVAYFGPAGSFTEAAARRQFGTSPEFFPVASIDEVFRSVEAGSTHYGVVPVENSTEGAVGRTLDLLFTAPVKICGEASLRIHQHLLSKAKSFQEIKRVYSHAQSLGQCVGWLNRNLGDIPRIPVANNAEAAKMAAADPESAAIAGDLAAERYGLDVLARSIEDEPNNTTRFLVLGTQEVGSSGNDKTSLVCSASNQPGAMFRLLEPLAKHGVSMSKLESRPAKMGLWEYVFYIDIDGHRSQPEITQALDGLRERAGFLKVLGSYPKAKV